MLALFTSFGGEVWLFGMEGEPHSIQWSSMSPEQRVKAWREIPPEARAWMIRHMHTRRDAALGIRRSWPRRWR